LKKVYQKVVLLCEVATLARDLQQNPHASFSSSMLGMSKEEFHSMMHRNAEMDEHSTAERDPGNLNDPGYKGGLIIDPNDKDARQGNLYQSQMIKISELLGAWYVVVHAVVD
jgi:hypothetical protein